MFTREKYTKTRVRVKISFIDQCRTYVELRCKVRQILPCFTFEVEFPKYFGLQGRFFAKLYENNLSIEFDAAK